MPTTGGTSALTLGLVTMRQTWPSQDSISVEG